MSNVELHRGVHDAFNNEGPQATAAYFAADVVYTDHPRGLTSKGKDEAIAWLQGWKTAFSDAHADQPTYIDGGDWTVAQFQGRGHNDGPLGDLPATGRQLDMPFCELLRWRDGKVVEGGIYFDTTTMMVQMGHMAPPSG